MGERERCKNCLEVLCAYDLSCLGAHMDAVDEHHADTGSPANDLCTRAPVVEVTGAVRCPLWASDDGLNCQHPNRPVFTLKITEYSARCFKMLHESESWFPDWCPFLTQKTGRPNAVLPAEEEEG